MTAVWFPMMKNIARDIFDYIVCKIKDLILFVLLWILYLTPALYIVSWAGVAACGDKLPSWVYLYVLVFFWFPMIDTQFTDKYGAHIMFTLMVLNFVLFCLCHV